MKTKKGLSGALVSALILLVATGVVIAQKRYMLANAARPEVKMNLVGSVERDSKAMTWDKAGAVSPGEVLTWTIDAENVGNAPALKYQATTKIPRGTEYVK